MRLKSKYSAAKEFLALKDRCGPVRTSIEGTAGFFFFTVIYVMAAHLLGPLDGLSTSQPVGDVTDEHGCTSCTTKFNRKRVFHPTETQLFTEQHQAFVVGPPPHPQTVSVLSCVEKKKVELVGEAYDDPICDYYGSPY